MEYEKFKDFIILQEPRQCTITDYEDTKKKITNIFQNVPSLCSIYQIGSVSTPGISDLDILFVFNDNIQDIHNKHGYKVLNNRDQYILMHGFFAINKYLFKEMRYFYIPGELRLLWGEELEIEEIPRARFLEKYIVSEFVLGIFFTLMRALENKVLKVRNLLCVLNALKYDFAVPGLAEETFQDGQWLVESISQLRGSWFALSKKVRIERLIEMLRNFPAVLLKFLAYIDENLDLLSILDYNESTNRLKFGINNYATKSLNKECKFAIRKNFLASLFEKLPYSKHVDDVHWALSSYEIKIPLRLFFLLAEITNSNLKSVFDHRNYLIKNYLHFAKSGVRFGLLLPTLRFPLSSPNLKWRGLIALRKLLRVDQKIL